MEGLRGVEECECPDTLEWPRESDGRDSRGVDGGNFVVDSGVLTVKKSVEGSTVGVGMLRVKRRRRRRVVVVKRNRGERGRGKPD